MQNLRNDEYLVRMAYLGPSGESSFESESLFDVDPEVGMEEGAYNPSGNLTEKRYWRVGNVTNAPPSVLLSREAMDILKQHMARIGPMRMFILEMMDKLSYSNIPVAQNLEGEWISTINTPLTQFWSQTIFEELKGLPARILPEAAKNLEYSPSNYKQGIIGEFNIGYTIPETADVWKFEVRVDFPVADPITGVDALKDVLEGPEDYYDTTEEESTRREVLGYGMTSPSPSPFKPHNVFTPFATGAPPRFAMGRHHTRNVPLRLAHSRQIFMVRRTLQQQPIQQ